MDEFEPEPEPLCEKTEYADIQRDEVLPLENKAVPEPTSRATTSE